MLKRLLVKNYVLIDSLEIDFPEGLIIITGQTGAGKSIILGSIGLVLGNKADASVIGPSADNCVVEAEFDVSGDFSGAEDLIKDSGAEWDDGHLIVRRVVSRSGRSRAFVNDCPVPVGTLVSLASKLVDIHSQHQTMLLSDKKFQMAVLDFYAGNASLLESCSLAWRSYLATKAELEELVANLGKAEQDREYNEARYSQLESASLKEGELEELEAEQKQLANAEEIKEHLVSAWSSYSGSSSDGVVPAEAALRDAEKQLAKISNFVPQLQSLVERISSCRVELDDVFAEVESIDSSVVVSPERLQEVDDRIALLYDLFRRFGCTSVSELIATKDELKAVVVDLSSLQDRKNDLQAKLDSNLQELRKISEQLHQSRVKASVPLAKEIMASIHFLELNGSVFDVQVIEDKLSATGSDSVLFRFSSTGKSPVEISKCASGGEMSRIMLCLKAMMARYTKMPTMIFDEIDTGVSGSVADKMGTMICQMGADMQVFAITHLPQVAAKGNAHYVVEKNSGVTSIRLLEGEDRVAELARMLSGSVLTEAAVANAKALLSGE